MNKFDLMIGAQVYCQDGKFGKLVKVVVKSKTQRVKSLVIEKGFLTKRHRVFPVSLVSSAAAGEVYLRLKNDDWRDYPAYQQEDFEVLRPLPEPDTPAKDTAVQIYNPYEVDGGDILIARRGPNPETAVSGSGSLGLLLAVILAATVNFC